MPKKRENQNIQMWFVVLNGCETWSLILREEHRLKTFGNGLLKKIFGPKRGDIIGECRQLHTVQIQKSFHS
jgi:hypothetical protein